MATMSMHSHKQIRDNALEFQDFLNDLQDWEQSMKEKDKNMGSQVCEDEKSNLPPVRVQKSNKRPLGSNSGSNQREDKSNEDGRSKKSAAASHTHDYFRDKWDKFDVDAALRDVDEREDVAPTRKDSAVKIKHPSKSAHLQNSLPKNIGDGNMSGYLGNSRTVDRLTSVFKANDSAPDAMSEKEQGNEYFKEKKYAEAIDCYSRSIVLQPTAVAFANRAMSYIKLRRFAEAESDCSEAIDLDDRYVKAYSRRGTARRELGKLLDAIDDFEFALRLEPENKELKKQYEEARRMYGESIGKKLPEKKARVVIEELKNAPALKAAEKGEIKAPLGEKPSSSLGCSSSSCDPALAKVPSKLESYPPKAESGVKQISSNSIQKQDSLASTKVVAACVASRAINSKNSQKQDSLSSTQAVAARAASRAVSAVAKKMTVPKTAYEFEAMSKILSGDLSAQAEMLKIIAPTSLPKIFKDAISAPLLMDIIRCVAHFFRENVDFAVQFLENLTKIGRFDMTIMCLSTKDKAALRQMWDEVFVSETVPVDFQEALKRLRSKYCR